MVRFVRRSGVYLILTKMQTFLPYPDFVRSVGCLDNKRLGKQRVEALQIINVLLKTDNLTNDLKIGWRNHPAVKMWAGHIDALTQYYDNCVAEWITRGFRNTMKVFLYGEVIFPPWFGDEEFHRSHRSNLLRKNYEHYSKYFIEPTNLPYRWPACSNG